MSYRGGINASRDQFKPKVDEVIQFADTTIAGISSKPELREVVRAWYEATTDSRQAAFIEKRDAPVQVGDVTLEVGKWYDVTVGTRSRSPYAQKPKTWRNCVYVGRVGSGLHFSRWGAKAETDPYARGQFDSAAIADDTPYGRGILAVAEITPSEALLAKASK